MAQSGHPADCPCRLSANKRLMHCNNWPLSWEPSGTPNATNGLCLRGLQGGEPAATEGDYFNLLKRHQPAVANSFAICAKPGLSACR